MATYPDVNRGPEILVICGIFVGIALTTVVLRIWTRAVVVKHVGWDDYVMMLAVTVIFAEMVVIIPQVRLGAGRHVDYIEPKSNIVKGLHLNFITQPLCLIALCLTKVSVGLFLVRMSPSIRYEFFIWGMIGFTIASSLGNLLTVFFQCQPLAFTWDTSIEGGGCIPPSHLKFAAFFNSSVSVLTDVIFALIPIPMIRNVHLNLKLKVAVAGILSLGVFAAVAAIVKITYLGDYGKYGDFLFDSSDLTIWTTVEICTAIIAACIPCLKPMFKKFLAGSSAGHAKGDQYDPRNSKIGYVPSNNDGPEKNNDIEMYRRSSTATIPRGGHSEIGSEESIILRQGVSGKHITKTTHIPVSVDDQLPRDPKSFA